MKHGKRHENSNYGFIKDNQDYFLNVISKSSQTGRERERIQEKK